jgi:hypothetical protein
MDRINKFKSVSTIPADPQADIALINQYSVKELTPQDVFCFSIILCDNEVDRDTERFTTASLDKLAPLSWENRSCLITAGRLKSKSRAYTGHSSRN